MTAKRKRESKRRKRTRKRIGQKKRFPASKLPTLCFTLTKLVKGIGPTIKKGAVASRDHCH